MSCFYAKQLIVKSKDGEFVPITAPCGKCLGCYIDSSSEWSMRAKLELRLHSEACFLTLTYNDEHLPPEGELSRKDVQDFLKRLRRALEPKRIRFYGCGEYGSEDNTQRPHYHLIIYGFNPDDLIYFYTSDDGDRIYKSAFVSKLWNNGFVTVGNVTDASIRYCSLYLQKQFKEKCQNKKVQPFRLFSRNPGIGYGALTDEEIVNDAIYIKGRKRKLPRSFINRLENSEYSEIVPIIKERRKEKSDFIEENCIDPWRDLQTEVSEKKKRLDIYLKMYYNKCR